jgi:hypothetical protein
MRRRFETRDASTDGMGTKIESRSDIRFEILYGRDGRRVITSRDRKAETMGNRLAMGELILAGQSAGYEIRGGRVITMLVGCNP